MTYKALIVCGVFILAGCDQPVSEASLQRQAAGLQAPFQSCIKGNADSCDRAQRETALLHEKAVAFCASEPENDGEICKNVDDLGKMAEAIGQYGKIARGEIADPKEAFMDRFQSN